MEGASPKPTLYTIRIMTDDEKSEAMKRLPKRLTYVLRYGALKEGLQVDDNGYVNVSSLTTINILKDYSCEELLDHIKSSVSNRNVPRYEWKDHDTVVRAAYLRNFERSPFHPGTQVPTLIESSMAFILNNLQCYDLEHFPDETLVRLMIRRLKRQKKLTSAALTTLLVPTITRLDLEDVYLTNKTLKVMWTQCPNLVAISFKNCGYIITDSVMAQIAKHLPKLRRLNLTGCDHLTTNCLATLAKRLPELQFLNVARGPRLLYESVLNFMKKAKSVTVLDVFYLTTTPQEHQTLAAVSTEKGIELILREPKEIRNIKSVDSLSGVLSENMCEKDAGNIDNVDDDYALAYDMFDADD